MTEERIYYPGLNGIRAIAAFIVLIFHIDLTTSNFGLKALGFHKTGMAGYGVILFFVLSGYLITSLLLAEKTKTNNVSVKNFYIRRILRIWPLYYFAIIVGLVFVSLNLATSSSHLVQSLALYTFFLPNVAFELKIAIACIAPLWSVGVEEQFYALWPWIMKKSKNVIHWLVAVIIIYFLIKLFARFSGSVALFNIITISAIDCMAIGGIGAYLVATKSNLLKVIYNKKVQVIAWTVLIVSCFYKPLHVLSFIDQELNAAFYLILIVNVSTNPKTIISLENKFFDFLGKISYGIYVYHFLIISLLSIFLKNVLKDGIEGYITLYISVIGSTLLVASLSYKYLEVRFLNLRKKYTIIASSNSRSAESKK